MFAASSSLAVFRWGSGFWGGYRLRLTVLTGVYVFGTISGGHFSPAVTLGAALARRVEWKALPGYWIVQVIGGLLVGLLIYLIAQGKDGVPGRATWRPMDSASTPRAATRYGR